jgi:S1-C subfamily serine protease
MKTRPALVVLVSVDRQGKAKSFGTGFFISKDGLVVTARHVARAERGFVVLAQDGKKLPVTAFIGEDTDYDIAVLKTEGSDCAHLSLANEALPRTNEWVALVSAQDAIAPSCSTGVVTSVMSLPGLFAAIATTVPVKAGQSGSPLLNPVGEVIGVVPYASPSQSATASPRAFEGLSPELRAVLLAHFPTGHRTAATCHCFLMRISGKG